MHTQTHIYVYIIYVYIHIYSGFQMAFCLVVFVFFPSLAYTAHDLNR